MFKTQIARSARTQEVIVNLNIHAKNIEAGPKLRDYVERKLGRLDRYLPHIAEVRIDLSQEKRREGEQAIAQLTVRTERGIFLRAEDKQQSDIFAAVDMVVDKMYRQISHYKGKRRRRTGERFDLLEPELAAAEMLPIDDSDSDSDDEDQAVVRRKHLTVTPMNEQEAIDQLELLGHTFFVFYNADTRSINVLYKRERGDYGLLEPSLG